MRRMLIAAAAAAIMALPAAAQAEDPISLVSVSIEGERDLDRLERLGLDVTHDVSPTDATVVLYSAAERARLTAAGFSFQTLVADLGAKSAADRAAEAEGVAVPAALPSGRTTYRVYDDFVNEMNALATDPDNAGLVRRVPIGETFEGREIFGLEIAEDVQRTDDGRPAYVNMGLHHAREWPSGEFPMEFAIDLVSGYHASDPEITGLLEDVRVFIFPVINADGYIASRGSAPSAGGAPVVVGGFNEFRRKNCRPAPGNPADAALPCSLRPNSGVDLNRNYGYYWGGPGASTSATSESYRGTGPFSEPESEAVHEFSSGIHPTVFISNHTFTDQGWWLRQPGFNGSFFDTACGPGQCSITPDETAMKALGDGMGSATGWPSDLGWELGDITGATEDWNYFAQGTYGYTPEARGLDFHSLYSDMVIEEYEGDAMHVGEGVRAAFLLAGDFAADPAHHGILQGAAPPGATLTLSKDFEAPTFNQPTLNVDEHLETTLAVSAAGTYEWHVMPSDRPDVNGGPAPDPGDETWQMTCTRPGSSQTFTKQVEVARGGTVDPDWSGSACGAPPVDPNVPPAADFTVVPNPPVVNQEAVFTSASTDSDGAIATTEWDFNDDGNFSDASGLVATHTFTTTGPHDVSVRVTDDDGDPDVEEKTLNVAATPPANQPPTANFDHFPVSPLVEEDITFTSAATDADGSIAAHDWDLDGDGAFDDAQGSQVTRAYTVAGTYEVSLRVTDNDGATDTDAATVVVREPVSGSCRGREPTVFGTNDDDRGANRIEGTPGADVIAALDGDDVVAGLGGNDVICGQHGRDILRGGRGGDFVGGGKGPDRIAGGRGNDRMRGGAGRDVVLGGPGVDTCRVGRGGLRTRGCP